MADRRPVDPRVLLPLAAVALVVFTAIAIFLTVGHSPRSDYGGATETSTTGVTGVQPPAPPR